MRLQVGLCPALTEDVMSKLKTAGVNNVISFMQKDIETLAMEASISYKDLQSIRNIIVANYAAFPLEGDLMLSEAVRSTVIISTGISSLDKLLGGGLMAGEIMELCGGWGVGKTSLCVQLALHCATKLGHRVLYIDPTGGVSTNRLEPHLDNSIELQESALPLSYFKVVTPDDVWGLFEVLNTMSAPSIPSTGPSSSSSKKGDEIKLVVVDSLPVLLTPVQAGSQRHGNGIVNQVACTLKQIASERQVAVVVVNNVVSATYDSAVNSEHHLSLKWKAALGRFWEHVPNTRLFMERVWNPDKTAKRPLSSLSDNTALMSLDVNITIWKSSRLKPASSLVSIISN
ncbi:DNA repair protein rad51d [Halocaridina rubra]|uniref:DNA repair protein rad51d n=1 Tax=Halocaridina rubra TaxID=373956 RepID=A0AAN8XHD0_HALRR